MRHNLDYGIIEIKLMQRHRRLIRRRLIEFEMMT
jgi:hypothetical protein